MCRNTIDYSIRCRISSASLYKRHASTPSKHIAIADIFDGQATSPGFHLPEPQDLFGC
jgi:hypothetical protein